jgi:hypothetical protein
MSNLNIETKKERVPEKVTQLSTRAQRIKELQELLGELFDNNKEGQKK